MYKFFFSGNYLHDGFSDNPPEGMFLVADHGHTQGRTTMVPGPARQS